MITFDWYYSHVSLYCLVLKLTKMKLIILWLKYSKTVEILSIPSKYWSNQLFSKLFSEILQKDEIYSNGLNEELS